MERDRFVPPAAPAVPTRPGPLPQPADHLSGVRIILLGGFALTAGDHDISLPAGAQRLVALLALQGRIGRSRLAGTLWPDKLEHRALGSLRTGIWRINQAIPDLVLTSGGQVGLSSRAQIDVKSLVALSIDVLEHEVPETISLGVCLQEGDLLPDWADPWLTDERERLHQLHLHLLERISEHLASRGDFGLAMECALSVLRADALRESAYRALVRIHLAEGNVHEAHRAFRACEQVLQRELGIAPSSAMIALLASHSVDSCPVPENL